MRVLLVQPDYLRKADGVRGKLLPARSLIEMAALLEARGHEVTVLDPLTAMAGTGEEEVDVARAAGALMEKEDFDAAGVAVYTATRKEAHAVAREIKARADIPVIAGGPHASRLAGVLLRSWKELDYVCLGAAENSLPGLLDALSGKGPSFRAENVAYRTSRGAIRENGKSTFIVDLDALPPPRYDNYLERAGGKVERAYVLTTRGCPHWCNFCSNLWKKVLVAGPAAVADEIEALAGAGVSRVIIYDDCFGARPDQARAVLEAVIAKGLTIELQAVTRFDAIEPGWLELFREAGGRDILAGIETGSSKLRRKMNKHMRDGAMCAGAELVRKLGLRLGVWLMFGFPAEEEEDVEATRRLVKKLDPDQVMSTVYDVKPGDVLFEFAMASGTLTPEAWMSEERRQISGLDRERLIRNAARAMAFDRLFTRTVLAPEHDPAGLASGIDSDELAPIIDEEIKRWG